tara:strand:+ start:405 stop:1043 length:639 start_codon:yes stop_codon:yes gene_type:complete
MSEYGYIPEAPEQSAFNNKGIFKPKDIYNLDQADKWTPQLGQLELIETVTADNTVAFYDFDNLGDYKTHFITANNIQGSSTTGQNLDIRVKVGGTVQTSNYKFAQQLGGSQGTFSESRSDSYSQFIWLSNVDNETNASASGYAYIYNATDSTQHTHTTHMGVFHQGTFLPRFSYGGSVHFSTVQASGIRVFLGVDGNVKDGVISFYGIKEYE